MQIALGVQILRFWKYMTFFGVELWLVLLGRKKLTPESIVWCRELWGELEKKSPFLGLLLEKGLLPPQGQKTLQVPVKCLSSAVWRGSTPKERSESMLYQVLSDFGF